MSGYALPNASAHRDRNNTVQAVGTPRDFLCAVEARFGRLTFDLAANAGNSVCGGYYFGPGSPWGEDALALSWVRDFCWLNPPFKETAWFARKAAKEAALGARIAMLTLASIGSNWFAQHVHGKALVLGLSPRLTFVGSTDPYPKDLMLSVYGPDIAPGFDVWRWRK